MCLWGGELCVWGVGCVCVCVCVCEGRLGGGRLKERRGEGEGRERREGEGGGLHSSFGCLDPWEDVLSCRTCLYFCIAFGCATPTAKGRQAVVLPLRLCPQASSATHTQCPQASSALRHPVPLTHMPSGIQCHSYTCPVTMQPRTLLRASPRFSLPALAKQLARPQTRQPLKPLKQLRTEEALSRLVAGHACVHACVRACVCACVHAHAFGIFGVRADGRSFHDSHFGACTWQQVRSFGAAGPLVCTASISKTAPCRLDLSCTADAPSEGHTLALTCFCPSTCTNSLAREEVRWLQCAYACVCVCAHVLVTLGSMGAW